MPHLCVSGWGQHWFRWWLVAYTAPSHYLNQCCVIVNWILSNTLQWKFHQNTKPFIHKNAPEHIVCKMAAILFRGRWVKKVKKKRMPKLCQCPHTYLLRPAASSLTSLHPAKMGMWPLQRQDQGHQVPRMSWGGTTIRNLSILLITWWRHQMETFSAILAICAGNSPVPDEFPAQRPVTRSFDVFFDLRLNKRLSKQ